MAHDDRNWVGFIKRLPGWITAFIALITALVGFVKLLQGDIGLVTAALLAVGTGSGMLGCAYLAFKRTPPLVEGGKGTWQYPRWRPYALAGLVIIPLLLASGISYYCYQKAQSPSKVIILIANFDGPEPEKYRVTEAVLARLRAALESYDDIQVEALGRTITEAEGSAAARAEGERHKASIVVWGWYGTTAEVVPLSVHFEVLRPPEQMPELRPEARGLVQTMAVSELESFALQTRLSSEMVYLSLFSVGMTRLAARDWDGAIACFRDALSQAAERVPALDQSIVYFYRGYAYGAKGDYDRAIADYDKAIQLQPTYAAAHNNRGVAYADKSDYAQAIVDYNQALRLRPNLFQAYYNRGNAYYIGGNYDSAITDYNQAISLKPDFAKAYNNRGAAYANSGDYDHAIADYGRVMQLQPDYAGAYNNRGVVYVDIGDYDHAFADLDQAIRLQPDYADAYFNRGRAYAKKGGLDRAISDYDQAIHLNPGYVKAYFNRGTAYKLKGEKGRAVTDFEKVLELSDDSNLRQQAEEQLRALEAK